LLIGVALCMVLMVRNIQIHLFGNGQLGGVISVLYYLITFVGIILLIGTPRQKLVYLVITCVMVLASAKRAGIIIMAAGSMLYYLCQTHVENRLNKRLVRYLQFFVIVLVALFFASWYITRAESNIIERFLSMFDDKGSGRFTAWQQVLDAYNNSSLVNKILGHGFHAVPVQVRPLGRVIYAHNSFLETLYDFGIVGFVWLVGIVLVLCKYTWKAYRYKHSLSPQMAYGIVYILLLSNVAGYFFDESRVIIPATIHWGLMIGQIYKEKRLKRSDK